MASIALNALTTYPLHSQQREGEVFLGMQPAKAVLACGWRSKRIGTPVPTGRGKSPTCSYPLFAKADELKAAGLTISDKAPEGSAGDVIDAMLDLM